MLILEIFSSFFILATFLPLIKWDYWWIRVFDYPRLQKLIINLILLSFWIILDPAFSHKTLLYSFGLILASSFLVKKVYPFTFLGKKMISKVNYDIDSGIHALVANIYQFNKKYDKVLKLVKRRSPDLVFLVETNKEWEKHMIPLEEKYNYHIKIPLENTYGLLFYTNLEIVRKEIHYLVDPEIPSLELDLLLRNGKKITVYAIHPTPPVPGENTLSTERDAEILIVGKKSKNNPLPSIVFGDLNDVAWSYTSELFLKVSEMADPRRGRGMYNTFHAKVPVFRWPLDHFFLSKHFALSSLKVHRGVGSDHFPISIKAVLTMTNDTDTLKADGEDKEEAHQKIASGLAMN
ncbi:endonuclease/exonuclease/phosphatase family protein [Algoriphagus sp.]|uniref:endonuclease/exonuclease/phosphatase family protein n=1 Tax=Algoriphagus sp. TaxID=1872435 RepID=UPI0026187152|nr:endonuclease/exonuclease/phosphatase family protein [Algoriphagus sp.]